jgi:hypothetical protein
MEGFYHASIASVRDSDLLNVCFGLLCRPKSDISRGPRSAKTGREQSQQNNPYVTFTDMAASIEYIRAGSTPPFCTATWCARGSLRWLRKMVAMAVTA